MKNIKFKVKTLILIILIVTAIGGGIYFLSDNILYAIGLIYENKGNEEMAGAYYKRVAENFPQSDSAIKGANKQIENLLINNHLGYFDDKIVISGFGTSKGGSNISYASLANINKDYAEILKYHKGRDLFSKYTIGVAIMNWFGGEGEKAIKLLETISTGNKEIEEMRKLNLSAMYMSMGEIEKGMRLIEMDMEKKDIYKYIRQDLLAYGYFMLEDYDKFRENMVDNSIRYASVEYLKEPYIQFLNEYSVRNIIENYNRLLEAKENRPKTGNVIEGVITTDGEPLSYGIVFVKDRAYGSMSSTALDDGTGIMAIAVSDKDGKFVIEDIPNGTYGLGVWIDWQRIVGKQIEINKEYDIILTGNEKLNKNIDFFDSIEVVEAEALEDNKLRFSWNDDSKDIDFYILSLGEVVETENKSQIVDFSYTTEKIKGTTITLDIEKERRNSFAGFMSWDMNGANPYYFLEPLYHEGDYGYKITGYDKGGYIVTDNMGIYSKRNYDTVHIKGEEWTKGDSLLLERDFEGAIAEYESAVNRNPEDIHSAKALAQLYFNGWIYEKDSSELGGKDYEKARIYLELLNEEIDYNEQIKSRLAEIYMKLGKYEASLELYNQLIDKESYYNYRYIGDIYAAQGNTHRAIENYNNFLNRTEWDHVVDDMMIMYILNNDTQSLEAIVKKYKGNWYHESYEPLIKEYITNIDRKEYQELFNIINQENIFEGEKLLEPNVDDLGRFYKAIILLKKNIDRLEKEQKYTQLYNGVKDRTLKELLRYFGKDNLRSDFGDTD